jgi:UDP-glucose 4-epimerase
MSSMAMPENSDAGPVLVTGASGFLGRHVVRLLLERQNLVVATYRALGVEVDALQKTFPDTFNPMVLDFRCDITDGVFANRQFRTVVHLASYVPPSRPGNILAELPVIHNGVLGATMRLLSALQGRYEHLILASSVAVYGTGVSGVVVEDVPCRPTDLYGSFKLACEWVCRCVARSEKVELGILRFTQLYGVGEPHGIFSQRVFVPQAQQGKPITLIRGGREGRDVIWVTEAAEAVVAAIEHRANGTFNIASGQAISIRQIAELIRQLSGKDFPIEISDDGLPALSQAFDSHRAREAFGWESRVDLAEGFRRLLQS